MGGGVCGVFDDVFLLYQINMYIYIYIKYHICMELVDFDWYCIHLCELKHVYNHSRIVRNLYVHVHH